MQINKSHCKVEYHEIYKFINKHKRNIAEILNSFTEETKLYEGNKKLIETLNTELAVLERLEKYTDNAFENTVRQREYKAKKKEGK